MRPTKATPLTNWPTQNRNRDPHAWRLVNFLPWNTESGGRFRDIAAGTRFAGCLGTMLHLSDDQRRMLIDKVPDVANVAAGALVFGQILAGQRFSLPLAAVGTAIWIVLVGWSFFLARQRQP
jgi:hypothetical protein